MERIASRPPPGGGNWAVFFAPLAVTGAVILGALVFVWSSDPEPVDRPEVERVDLSELAPVPESPPLSSVEIHDERRPGRKTFAPTPEEELEEAADEEEEPLSDGEPSVTQDGQEDLSKQEQIDRAFAEAHEKLNKVPEEMLKHMPVLRHAREIIEERELRRAGVLGEAIEPTVPDVEGQVAAEQSSPNPSSVSEPAEPQSIPSMGAAGAQGR